MVLLGVENFQPKKIRYFNMLCEKILFGVNRKAFGSVSLEKAQDLTKNLYAASGRGSGGRIFFRLARVRRVAFI